MPGPYSFTGYVTTGFPDYRDTATGRMLVAEPGGSYGMQAINLSDPVPPGSQWVAASAGGSSGAPPGPPPVPSVPAVPSVNGQEGGE